MKLLLDTQIWLWMTGAPAMLSARSRKMLQDGDNQLLLSAATPWEIAIKVAVGKLRLPCEVEEFYTTRAATTRITPLEITALHAIESARLPLHHRDPFDRVIIAQARIESVPVMTVDRAFAAYEVETVAGR
jgi:PIN domain nuclease of toxin-antitoxin system